VHRSLSPTACLVRIQTRVQTTVAHLVRRSESGASVVEYGLLLALIALVAVIAVRFMGTRLSSSYSNSAEVYP
jgi:pilus assembly protein Flp/PilA